MGAGRDDSGRVAVFGEVVCLPAVYRARIRIGSLGRDCLAGERGREKRGAVLFPAGEGEGFDGHGAGKFTAQAYADLR